MNIFKFVEIKKWNKNNIRKNAAKRRHSGKIARNITTTTMTK